MLGTRLLQSENDVQHQKMWAEHVLLVSVQWVCQFEEADGLCNFARLEAFAADLN